MYRLMKTRNILSVCCVALLTLPALASCLHQDGVKMGYTDRPTFLKDSERWGKVVVDTLSNVSDVQVIVNADMNADVYYEQSNETCVVVEANEKVRQEHKVYVKGETLTVKPVKGQQKNLNTLRHPSIVVRVYSPAIRKVVASGMGDVKAKSPVSLPTGLRIESTGTGDVEFHNVTCEGILDAESSGTGDIELESVTATSARVVTEGTGDIDIDNLTCADDVKTESSGTGEVSMTVTCKNLIAITSGTGDVELHVDCDQVDASAIGTGDLELSGKTKRLIKEKSGLSNIRSKELKVKDVEY